MNALKAMWNVQAGLIIGEPMHEYSRSWSYTSKEYQSDQNKRGPEFQEMQAKATAYATGLQNGGLNWVNLTYVWL